MKQLLTFQDYTDRVKELRKDITKRFGIKFGGATRQGSITYHCEGATLMFDTYYPQRKEIRKNGELIFSFEQLVALLQESYPELTYHEREGFTEFGVDIYFTPKNYLRVAYNQMSDVEPRPIYIWDEKGDSIVYTHGPCFERSFHYAGKLHSSNIFATYEEAAESLKHRLKMEIDTLTRTIQHAQKSLDKAKEQLAALKKN